MDQPADPYAAVGSLIEPTRRALYDAVVAAAEPVSREQAAELTAVPLHSAKFHLDRLVDEGLLDVEYRRISGRSGPGAGRPAKLYRRSDRTVQVSLPPRHYDLVGAVLATAVEEGLRKGTPLPEAVARAARDAGRRLAVTGVVARGRSGLRRLAEVLSRHGYEPRVDASGHELQLDNCPFDRLAREHTDLVCGMNLALVDGVVEGIGCTDVATRLEPSPDHCCVRASRT